jgi:hypothetical protein
MILETTQVTDLDEEAITAEDMDGGDYTGDASELVEMANDLMSDSHNLTVALARFEHRAIMESAGDAEAADALMEGAVGQFFTTLKDNIVKYWKRFTQWVMNLYTRIRDAVLGPRKEWLGKNMSELKGFSDFGDAKVSFGSKLLSSDVGTIFARAKNGVGETARAVNSVDSNTKPDGFKDKVSDILFVKTKDKTFSTALEEFYIGASSEQALSSGLVGKLEGAAEKTFKNADMMPALAAAGKAVVAVAVAAETEGTGNAAGGSKEAKAAAALKLKYAGALGPIISSYIAACVSVNSKANSQVMSALVKALNAGRAKKGAKKEANAGTDLLAAYM